MPIAFYVRRGAASAEIPPDTSHETSTLIEIVRQLHMQLHQQQTPFAVVANLKQPSADLVIISRHGIGVVEMKGNRGPITAGSDGTWYDRNRHPIKAGSARLGRINPHEQVQAYAEEIRVAMQPLLRAWWKHGLESYWRMFRMHTAVCFTNRHTNIDNTQRQKLEQSPPVSRVWEQFAVLMPGELSVWALALRFGVNEGPPHFGAFTLRSTQIEEIVHRVLHATPWTEVSGLLPHGRPLAALIILQDGQRSVTRFAVKEDTTTIGRDTTSGVLIPATHARVSKTHATIRYHGDGEFYLRDNSRHGTWVNGILVTGEQLVTDGAHIILGGPSSETAGTCTLEFCRDPAALPILPTAS
jgi:hypothetical protein